jgi:hypothetical protein
VNAFDLQMMRRNADEMRLAGRGYERYPRRMLAAHSPHAVPQAPADDSIEVFDHQGRVVRVGRVDWRDKVLMPNLDGAKEDMEQLYALLVGAIVDGFAVEVLDHATYLAAHDPQRARGIALLGAVYLACDRVDDAERVLVEGLASQGDDALLLCNLARVYDARNDAARTDATLWKSLTLDPNQDFGFAWFLDRAASPTVDGGIRAACERVAALPGSWRARVVLAGAALKTHDFHGAAMLHDEATALAPRPVPSDLLLQMSGNLGKSGRLEEMVTRVGPLFDAEHHNFFVGANLMKAYLGLERPLDAKRVFDALCKEDRVDWAERLDEWRDALASFMPGAAQA